MIQGLNLVLTRSKNNKIIKGIHLTTLDFTENDETLSKWRWLTVKQIGAKPCARSGISAVAVAGKLTTLIYIITFKDPNIQKMF